MKKRWIGLGLLGAIVVVSTIWRTEHVRYRLTLEVATPSGLASGSSVIGVTRRWPLSFDPFQFISSKVQGQAVFVDLGSGRHVIAILASGARGGDVDWPILLFNAVFGPNARADINGEMAAARAMAGRPVDLTSERQPTLVTFTDITNPATAKVVWGERVDYVSPPGGGQQRTVRTPIDEIAATFGPGYAFRRATVEIVPAGVWPFNLIPAPWPVWLFGTPITRGIEGRLVWWYGPNRPALIAARSAGLALGAIDVEYYFIRNN